MKGLSLLITSIFSLGFLLNQACLAEDAPTTQPTDIQSLKNQEQQSLDSKARSLPVLGNFKIDQVLRLRLVDKRIVASTDLKPSENEQRVTLDGFPGFSSVLVQLDPARNPPGPQYYKFERYNFSEPQIVFVHSAVYSHPGYVQIAGDWQYAIGDKSISLIDQEPSPPDGGDAGEGGAQLFVQAHDDAGQETIKLHLRAPDLPTLLRQYPRELDAYLRPVMRELGQESLLNIDPEIAWQVFAAQRTPEPKALQQVQAILPQLDDPAFEKREAAADALRKLGSPGAVALLSLDRTKLSPEQNTRIDDVLTAYQQLNSIDVRNLRNDPGFLIDCLSCSDPDIRRLALARLREVAGKKITFDDPSSDPTHRSEALDQLRTDLLPAPATQEAGRIATPEP